MRYRSSKVWRMLGVVAIALVLGALMQATLIWAAPPEATSAQSLVQSDGERDYRDDDHDDDHDDPDELIRRYGVVMTRPEGVAGEWVIGTHTYSVTEQTLLEGTPDVGTCVEVKALPRDVAEAVKITVKDVAKCEHNDDDDDHDDDDDDDDIDDDDRRNRVQQYGVIESRPEGKVGVWVIGGESYTATEQTELDFDHGRLVVGTCAKVESTLSAPRVAREIESENDYKCRPRDQEDNARGLLFGLVEELPEDLDNGIWGIGGMHFVVSPTTELITKGGTFTVGTLVKVEFRTNLSDTNFAQRIEIKYAQVCRSFNQQANMARDDHGGHGDDDRDDDDRDKDDDKRRHPHRYGYCPGGEGKTIGLIDSRPAGVLLGEWVIGGLPYVTNEATRFAPGDDFLTGERVKVEYVIQDDNRRLVTKLEETGNNGGVSNPRHSLIVGFVDAKPEAFIGQWIINGESFSVTADSQLFELGSLFAEGAYVVVEYDITNDARVVIKMVTYVPPGAGDDNTIGKLQAIGKAETAQVAGTGADAFTQNNEVWTVDGVDFVVSEATQLVDNGGELAPGATVYVNSYTENGQRYATMIRMQSGELRIPFAAR